MRVPHGKASVSGGTLSARRTLVPAAGSPVCARRLLCQPLWTSCDGAHASAVHFRVGGVRRALVGADRGAVQARLARGRRARRRRRRGARPRTCAHRWACWTSTSAGPACPSWSAWRARRSTAATRAGRRCTWRTTWPSCRSASCCPTRTTRSSGAARARTASSSSSSRRALQGGGRGL